MSLVPTNSHPEIPDDPLHWRTVLIVVALVSFSSVLAGCGGPQGPKRYPISGTVTREGMPVDQGNIQFVPTGGGPAAGSSITDGQYKFTMLNGPVAGNQKVEIIHFPPREEVPPGTPKKDAKILPDDRFKRPMPKGGWIKEAVVGDGEPAVVDFDLDE